MTNKSRKSDPKKRRQFWESQIENWQQSGLRQAEYCRKNNLKQNRMIYWRKRIGQTRETGVSFVPLKIIPAGLEQASRANLSVTTPNGFKIEIGNVFDPTLFKQIITTVQAL